MSSTTLVTFLLTIPFTAASVSILGSWDNFRKPYPLRRDARVGQQAWRGCHSFEDIICDGERVELLGKGRNGGLLMGGTYWYFYQIDGDAEYCDPSRPTSRACPFLPGQKLNILEVPTQSGHRRMSNDSTASSTTYTFNPGDKYLSPSEPLKREDQETSQQAAHAHAVLAYRHSPPSHAESRTKTPASPLVTGTNQLFRPYTRNSDGAIPSDSRGFLNSHSNLRGLGMRRSTSMPAYTRRPAWLSLFPPRNMWSAGNFCSLDAQSVNLISTQRKHTQPHMRDKLDLIWQIQDVIVPKFENDCLYQRHQSPYHSAMEIYAADHQAPRPSPVEDRSFVGKLLLSQSLPTWLSLGNKQGDIFTPSFSELNLFSEQSTPNQLNGSLEGSLRAGYQPLDRNCNVGNQAQSKTVSPRSSAFFSGISLDTSNTNLSTNEIQPATPSLSRWSINAPGADSPLSDAEVQSCDWYNLPTAEHASVLTLQTLRALPDDLLPTPTRSLHTQIYPASERVQAWNETVDTPKSALEELCEEMGYLGSLIQ